MELHLWITQAKFETGTAWIQCSTTMVTSKIIPGWHTITGPPLQVGKWKMWGAGGNLWCRKSDILSDYILSNWAFGREFWHVNLYAKEVIVWGLQPVELITACEPNAARERVSSPGYCLIIQELVTADQRKRQSSYIEDSGARCWNNFPLRISKFPQLMEQKLLEAKAPLVLLLNCLTTLLLDEASITVLSKPGTSGTGFHWQALQATGVIIQASKLLSSGLFRANLRSVPLNCLECCPLSHHPVLVDS